ncbi:protein kinase domain-containing protein [Streptomyces gougerotii]|uniref:protein kinase domain-containing protein n=1 Tax=Streptomyces gougerotii TaxID=53448 RepID=UPI0035310F96
MPTWVTIHHIVSSAEVEHPWLVMELVPGGSFQDRLERGPCTPTETARLGRGVLAGLRAAHGAGILHRDVKPGNVLLRADGPPCSTDFGIAAITRGRHRPHPHRRTHRLARLHGPRAPARPRRRPLLGPLVPGE